MTTSTSAPPVWQHPNGESLNQDADVTAMFKQETPPPQKPKQNKRLSAALIEIAMELRGHSMATLMKQINLITRKRSRITSRVAQQMLTGLRRRRALKRIRSRMAKRSRAVNR